MSTENNPFAQFGQQRRQSAAPSPNPFAQFDTIEAAPIAETPQPAASPHLSTMVKGLPAAALQAHIEAGRGLLQGLSDPVWGGAQVLAHGYADVAKHLAPRSRHAGWAKQQVEKLDRLLSEREADYQAKTPDPVTAGIFRFGGQMGPALFTGGASAAQRAAPLLKKMGHSAAISTAASTLQPITTTNSHFTTEKQQQALNGAIAGGLLPLAGAGIARIVSPKASRNPAVQTLLNAGVTPTPGRMLGGTLAQLEDKLASTPILGDAIRYRQRQAVEELNRAAYARVLAPIGKIPSSDIGREGVEQLARTLSESYEKLLPQLTFRADAPFVLDLVRIREKAVSQMPISRAKQLIRILDDQVRRKLIKTSSVISGRQVKRVESELGMLAAKYGQSASADERLLGGALEDIHRALRHALERTNPDHAEQLANINRAYAHYVRIRNAASRLGAKEGVFTPSQLAAAVRSTETSRAKGNYARGRALMQDLSDAGVHVLGPGYPDSGTAARLLWGAGTLSSGAILPQIPASLVGLSAPYLPVLNRLTAYALAKRPAYADQWAKALRALPPAISWPIGSQAGQKR